MSLLAVEDLAIRVPGGLAVDGVSFTLAPGEVLGLMGESGAGKSLTGAALLGLLPAGAALAGGRIQFDGARLDLLAEAGWRRLRGRRIGAVFQDPATALDPLQRVGAQLAETLRHHGKPPSARLDVVGAWLAAVGLPAERARAYPHELSGGMRQRVAIALALCPGPDVLVADEPTTALDMPLRGQVAGLLRRLARAQRASVLLISHDVRSVAAAADRVAVMYAGRLAEIGPAEQVLRAPAHPYTRALLASVPGLDARVDRLAATPGAMPPPGAVPPGCAFAPRCARADAACLRRPPLVAGVACWHAGGYETGPVTTCRGRT